MWQFSRAIDGIAEACHELDCPVVSGNVSFYNETAGRGIAPTPMIGMVGLIEDRSAICGMHFKRPGDIIILLGITREELGGSEYLSLIHGIEQGLPPQIDLSRERSLGDTLRALIATGSINNAHDCSDGGLAVAIAECCIGDESRTGCSVEIEDNIRLDAALFGESQGRAIISCAPESTTFVHETAKRFGTPSRVIGTVTPVDEGIVFRSRDSELFSVDVDELHKAWSTGFQKELGL
jgi:phosphoribosylformylglycinamidine synthase